MNHEGSHTPRVRSVLTKFLVIVVLGVVSLPVVFLFAPHIEQSATEARLGEAYWQVCRIHKSDPPAPTADPLPSIDPWGQPYRTITVDDHIVRIVSSGPNMSSPDHGFDDDDIYSDMPRSPTAAILAQKNRQWLLAFGMAAAAWLFLAAWYLRSSRVR